MGTRRTGPGIVSSGSGSSISTMSFGRSNAGVLKDRANMSFMLVVMFFAVFGVIVLTEIFLIDEKRGNGGTGAFGGHRSGHRLTSSLDRPDYEEVIADDYATLKGGFDAQIGLLLMNSNAESKAIESIPSDPRSLSSLPPSVELKLPALDQNLPMTDAEWLPVTNTRYKFFVYSAYYDDRVISGRGIFNSNSGQISFKQKGKSSNKSPGLIRIIGATKTKTPDGVWCRLWYRVERNATNITASVTVAAKIKVIRENWSLKYSACFVICPLPPVPPIESPDPKATLTPEAVSVVAKLRTLPTNRIFIQNRPKDRPTSRGKLAICVKPLHYDYNRVLQLIEFIELHRLLGVSHFTLYNDTVGTEAGCALKYYENQGIVSFLPWHRLDMISQREIRTENLFAALNDCLYRSMYKYEYIALLDLDEFIIPRHNDTIPQLIRWISSKVNPKTSSAFSFQNAFFYLQWADDPWITVSKTPTEAGLITLRKTRRKSKLHPHKQRSKYICKPRDIVEAGNHFVWEFLAGHGTLNVPADAAILHHYRVCEFGGDDCVKTPSIIDRTAYKYRDKLADAVDKVWMELEENCVLPELEAVPALSPLVPSSPNDIQTR
ncbi:uncharacterized protein [Chelonus insularis]|uniref:uncharacterized protein n=1 Tax=Chelonus insularis TaxID=460826 RepID=UPI00158B717A|nr:uncharacterized protein LOC118068362 [Chelonus insularis]XP_034941589.1 uncharacterized protein LOC118068362 [Chelonus insularis]XP_034941591.1 uncharacterized protein LOC118068362 [Chelonus insularis]